MFPEWVRDPSKAHLVSLLSNPSSWVGNKMLSEMGSYYFLSEEIGQRIFMVNCFKARGGVKEDYSLNDLP